MVKLRQKNQEFILTFIASYILLKLEGLNIMQAGVSPPFSNLTDEEIGPREEVMQTQFPGTQCSKFPDLSLMLNLTSGQERRVPPEGTTDLKASDNLDCVCHLLSA